MYDTRIRTTSALESNNNQLRMKIEPGSNFFKFVQMLIQEEAVKARDFDLLIRSGGAYNLSHSTLTTRQIRIEEGTKMLMENTCTAEDFLARVAHVDSTRDLCDDFDIEGAASQDICIVCYERKRSLIMDPCGHFNICSICFKEVEATQKEQFKLEMREWNEVRASFDSDDSDFEDPPEPVYRICCVECQIPVTKTLVVYQN